MKKIILAAVAAILFAVGLSACSTEADTVDKNLSKDAESFKVQRNVVFINAITGEELLRVEGRCSYETPKGKVTVLCKVGPQSYVRHAMVLSDNVTAVMEQTLPNEVDPNHYKFVFRPQTLIPEVDTDTNSVDGK
jgi:hypothetical protein